MQDMYFNKVKSCIYHPTDRKSVIEYFKRQFKNSLYEECDFEVTDKYISIGLLYDSKSYVSFYQSLVSKRYPSNTKLQGSHITVYFGED